MSFHLESDDLITPPLIVTHLEIVSKQVGHRMLLLNLARGLVFGLKGRFC
jgi:hypothetical protein